MKRNVGRLTIYKSKDEKGGLCFIDGSRLAFGTLPALRAISTLSMAKSSATNSMSLNRI